MLNKNTNIERPQLDRKHGTPRLRDHHQLMDPEEMTIDERWDRIVELLAMMTAEQPVLIDEIGA